MIYFFNQAIQCMFSTVPILRVFFFFFFFFFSPDSIVALLVENV